MNASDILKKYRDLKVVEVVRYNPDVYCDVASIPKSVGDIQN
jgi:hypothetical protein